MASRSTRARVTKKTPTKAPAPVAKEEEETKVVVEEAKAEATTNGDKKEEVTEEVKAEGEEEIEGDEAEGEELGEEELDEEAEQKLLEGEEETEEKEGDETKEVKEEDKKEKEQTEEEKKAAEEAKKAKAAAEKKQADEKRKTYIPSAGKYNQDEHVYMRLRSVVVGPLELEDLQKELVQDMANKSEEFFYRFHFIEKEEKHVGHIEFRFKSITEADKMIETLKTIKEGVVVKRLVGGMNAAKFDKDVRGINDESEKEKYKRIVAVGGVPESATMEKLQEVFPDARVKFIALKPDGTPKWYAYLELADEEAAKKFAESHKEVEYEGEKLYCRSLRPGKPEDADIDPDHVMSEEERRKLQARINTMKYKLNGGAVLRPLDAQRLRRRVSQLQSLLRANQKRKGGAGDQPEGTPAAAANKTPNKTPQAGANQAGARRGGARGGMRGGMRGGRGGNQGGVMRGGRFGPGGPNRNMGGPGFHGNMQQQGMQSPMVSPRQQGFYGAGRGRSPAMNQGQMGPQQQQQQQGGRQGGNNMYNNPRQTANAVNMLVGLTNLLSQARNQGGSQGGNQRGGNQGNQGRNQNQGNFNNQGGNQGGNFGGNGGGGSFNDGGNYGGGNFNNQGNGFNQGGGGGGGFGGNQGGNFNNQGGGFGGNQGGNFGGNQGGNFNNQGGNRKRPFTGGPGQGQNQQGQNQGKNKQRRRSNNQSRGRF